MRIGSHFFAYLSRMRFIQRWALMRNTAPENVHVLDAFRKRRELLDPECEIFDYPY